MGKNILIFSDGTGQGGGISVDEQRSNVYKLFRATRSGTDSCISPSQQIAFYDPGLGSPNDGLHIKLKRLRWLYNWISKITGLGITRNIIDCYARILQVWEPGDRIYLYGFSRGAYTARCVGGVLSYCGVPTEENGQPIKRDDQNAHRIAKEAVKKIYQHGVGRQAPRFKKQRKELAQQFREKYACDCESQANTVPYFIGVWDTVAALGISFPRIVISGFIVLVLCYILMAIGYLPTDIRQFLNATFLGISVPKICLIAIVVYTIFARIKFATGLSDPWWKTLHWQAWKMKFYDTYLNPRVKYAKHALSIDENRKDFKQVSWTDIEKNHVGKENSWFEQVWFAGVHSDIGGSYLETESRLSDIALQWMVERSQSAKQPILIDKRYLNLYPDPSGVQHDERKSNPLLPLAEGLRKIPNNAPLHPSVIERFKIPQVVHFDEVKPYRPSTLRHHESVKHFYQ